MPPKTKYFNSLSNLVQVNATQIYVIGGHANKQWATLLDRDYDVPRSCIRIDLESGEFDVRSSLLSSRF